MSQPLNWAELTKQTSAQFAEQVQQYIEWAKTTEQVQLLDTGATISDDFVSIVIVTNQNIIQLIYNQETKQTTVGTSSRDACMYAVNVWAKLQQV